LGDQSERPVGSAIRLFLVDAHKVFTDALAARLAAEEDFVVTGHAASPEAALRAMAGAAPDVVIVDVALGASGEQVALGVPFIEDIRLAHPEVRVVVVTGHDDAPAALAAVRAGASAFLPKSAPVEELARVVRGVLEGETHIPPRLLTFVLDALERPPAEQEWKVRLARLTARERDVLEQMVAGVDQTTAARRLFLSLNTVRTHTKHILAKLEVHSTLEAVSIALRGGMRPSGEPDPTRD
jgi:two-component system NarL family response regulator